MNILGLRKQERGFSILEMLVVLVLMTILVGFSWPSLQRLIVRNKLQAVTFETATVFAIARLEAIKIGFPTVVRVNPATKTVQAFVDDDQNGQRNGAERILRSYQLPRLIGFGGPPSEPPPDSLSVVGFTVAPAGLPNQVVFDTNGAVRDTGAFRLREVKPGNPTKENYFEVRMPVQAATSFQIRKWDPVDKKWKKQDEGGEKWKWKM